MECNGHFNSSQYHRESFTLGFSLLKPYIHFVQPTHFYYRITAFSLSPVSTIYSRHPACIVVTLTPASLKMQDAAIIVVVLVGCIALTMLGYALWTIIFGKGDEPSSRMRPSPEEEAYMREMRHKTLEEFQYRSNVW